MAKQILFTRRNKLDISDTDVIVTASEGNEFVNFMRNRLNTSAWATSGTLDANNTTIEVNFVNSVDLECIRLVKHNFKSYEIQYWNGASYVNFPTDIDETTNTLETTFHEFTLVTTTKIKLTIRGTFVPDEDKVLFQFIATDKVENGWLEGWPEIKSTTISRQKVRTKLISGKESIKEQIGFIAFKLTLKLYSNSNDLRLFQRLYTLNEGFLVWLSGGDSDQFSFPAIGYRKEDVFLVKTSDEYQPEFYKSIYSSGLVVNMDFQEVVD